MAPPDLDDLYVTGGRESPEEQALAGKPLAGSLFRLRPGAAIPRQSRALSSTLPSWWRRPTSRRNW